ncbi:glycosyl transferase family 29 (putative sialyltransferase) [Salegentibacter sp. 24]|uniref:glycosyltransferase family 29 protein n=1 Tax=Salegentibacter sp. 24 TaxID=2183986 RepID=UPI00105BD514|nr:glycosyltransferase family 29 protein [Salegentibacter sp. 24]TDN82167.1 glycosyl transferase family 29 (putative sialyltransferase) [Salegentibacter sp. 24]
MLLSLRIFNIKRNLKNKRVAIVGAANSIFEEQNGGLIDSYDIVIRINKAAQVWEKKKSVYLGTKFTYLFHSFYENDFSGGGEIDFRKFENMGIEKLINPNYSRKGLRTHLNFYKRHLKIKRTYILAPKISKSIEEKLQGYVPTVGFSAVIGVLMSDCKEIYITGFTFFKTPYAQGYRKELTDLSKNNEHLKRQGIHNPDLEFEVFKKQLNLTSCNCIKMDETLNTLIRL